MYKSWLAFSVTEEIEVLHLASHGQQRGQTGHRGSALGQYLVDMTYPTSYSKYVHDKTSTLIFYQYKDMYSNLKNIIN